MCAACERFGQPELSDEWWKDDRRADAPLRAAENGRADVMKILIADDEDYTREGLIDSIDWERFEIDEIMQASNGSEAVRIAKWFLPDIVLTDVRMPKLDGIEFATRLLEWNPDCRIIFMSGYMEIEYLKSAIRLAAIDYIEKPIDLNVMCKALQKAVDEIRLRHANTTATQTSREFQQQRLFNLLVSKEADVKTLQKLAAETKFPLHAGCVCLILQMQGKRPDWGSAMETVNDIIQSFDFKAVGNFQREKHQYEFVLSYSEKEQYRLPALYQRILDAVPGSRLGIGMEAGSYKNVYNSYRTACAAINCAFYQEKERLFGIDEGIMQKSFIEPGIYGEFLQILSEQPDKLSDWFEGLFEQLYSRKYYQKEQVYTLLISFLTAIYRKYPELYEAESGIWMEEQIQSFVREMESLREIETFICSLLKQLREKREEQLGYGRVIRGVMEYVAEHYGEEDLSVVQIAEYLHFSPAYLNVLFKQEMKITLKQYLSNYRLERAKKLLEQGYDKITEIAVRCGYANANYFAKVFREATGMSPAEYRREKGEKI